MPSRIGDALHWFATYTPRKTAIISSLGSQTYEQLWSRVRRLANSLSGIGIKPGDRVALLMQNSSRYLELYQAAALMGVAVVPLNFRFVASEIEYVV
ncbi:AMP-binding protein, partial [Afipia sp. OHSU_II-uncloned]